MDKSWLKKQVTAEEIIKTIETEFNKYELDPQILVRYRKKDIDPFLNKIKSGDEVWFFSSPDDTWMSCCGREGYVIYRNGKEKETLITRLN